MSEEQIARLERRLAREKAARLQAEAIAEKGLRDLFLTNQNLDQTVTERTRELNSARDELEHSAARREAFLASLSRHVRTPLNGVIGMLDLLDGHVSDSQARSYVDAAKGSATALLRLFSRLILFVDLDDGVRVEPADVDLAAFLSGITDRWSRDAMGRGQLLFVENGVPSDTKFFTIGEHLNLLLGEMVENCILHCKPGKLTVDAQLDGDNIVFRISDTGSSGGTNATVDDEGMGLALADRLAPTIGARIEVPRVFEGPSTVTVTVPLQIPS